jgi:DNA-binding NarL/FixJ family response regulator
MLMDIRMPHVDGLEATRRIVADPTLADVKVVVLTTFEIDEYVFDALRAGAAGFLLKDAEVDEIVRAVRVVAEGASLLSPSVTRRVVETFVGAAAPTGPAAGRLAELTERETEIVALVATGLSNGEIAERLVISRRTAEHHVQHIYGKVGVSSRAALALFALEHELI